MNGNVIEKGFPHGAVLADIEEWCRLMRAYGAPGNAAVEAVIDPSPTRPNTGLIAALAGYPQVTRSTGTAPGPGGKQDPR